MDELMNKISNFVDSVTNEDIEKMTPEERKEFISLMDKLEARVEVIKEMIEEGEM